MAAQSRAAGQTTSVRKSVWHALHSITHSMNWMTIFPESPRAVTLSSPMQSAKANNDSQLHTDDHETKIQMMKPEEVVLFPYNCIRNEHFQFLLGLDDCSILGLLAVPGPANDTAREQEGSEADNHSIRRARLIPTQA